MRDRVGTQGGWWHAHAGPRARLAGTVICGVLSLLVAACSGGGTPKPPGHTKGVSANAGEAARVTITPRDGSHDAKPNHGVKVTVTRGKLSSVTVLAGHSQVAGALSKDATSWQTNWDLHTGTHYRVTATAVGTDHKTVTATSSFRTLTPTQVITASTVLGHRTYGVGMPIMINFSAPVVHKKAVERAVQIKSSKPVVGAFFWDGDQVLQFRPRTYWRQHTKVSFVGHFNGIEAAPGAYMTANLSQHFTIGNSLIAKLSTRTHYMMVYYKNKVLGRWPVSTGMPGKDTANGTYLTIEKANPTRMKGHGYNVLVPLAVRFTWSGNYIHWADWSVAEQGHVNVSHGCVNISPAHAASYYPKAVPGDPVTVTGSPVAGQWGDGWTAWFWTFKQVLKHSATHLAVQVGPDGSTLVDPSALPPPKSRGVLHSSKRNNYLAK